MGSIRNPESGERSISDDMDCVRRHGTLRGRCGRHGAGACRTLVLHRRARNGGSGQPTPIPCRDIAPVRHARGCCGTRVQAAAAVGIDAKACCGAQVFLNSGDGVVFKGIEGNWYEAVFKEYHLSEDKASELMTLVLENYLSPHPGPRT